MGWSRWRSFLKPPKSRDINAFCRRGSASIVVDNGCTDHSASVARSFGVEVVEEPRRGVTWAAFSGYNAAVERGLDVVVRIDADVVVDKHFASQWRRAWSEAPQRSRRDVVALTGTGRFEIPG